MRRIDLIGCLYDAGIAALPMVALVNLLIGGILACVGVGAACPIVENAAPSIVAYGSGTLDWSPLESAVHVDDVGLVDAITHTVGKLADAIVLDIRQGSARSALRPD
jgi:hypothetical protein